MNSEQKYPIGYTLKKLLHNVNIHNKQIYIFFIIYTLTASIYPYFGIVLPKILIEEITLLDKARINYVVGVIIVYLIATAVIGFIRTFVQNYAYPNITKLRIDYLRDMFDKIVSIDYKYMEDANFFEENDRALEATSSNNNGIECVYHKLFEVPAIILSIVGLMIFVGILNIWILLGLFINVVATIWIGRKVHSYQYSKKADIAHTERKKRYYYNTTHDFSYGKDIRLYQFKERILNNYEKEISGYVEVHKKIKNKEYVLGFIGLITLLLSDGLTYGFLIYKTALGSISIADFSMYIGAIAGLSLMLRNVATQITYVINEGQYVYDFYKFMESDLGEQGGNKKAISGETIDIVFDNVSFKYPKTEKYIFKNLNFTIHKGERLAIVGINGAGKSTLVKLMTGLFDVTEGEIRINNIPIQEFNRKELFSMFSVVFQDVNILAYTVKENVACTTDDINLERVDQALEKVGLHQKVNDLPNKKDQMMLKIIEQDGVEFSGGESQKLSIARALYKDGNMVIMDEPTAALDALAEAEIYENFSELVKGKTAVYISHRLASTKFCDKIALFDNDGLKEYGNHEELMNARGSYYEMFTVQGKYYNTEEGVTA